MKIINLKEENNRTIIQSINGIAFFNEKWMNLEVNSKNQNFEIETNKKYNLSYDS